MTFGGFMFVKAEDREFVCARIEAGDLCCYCVKTGAITFNGVGRRLLYAIGDTSTCRRSGFLAPGMDLFLVSRIVDFMASAAGLVSCCNRRTTDENFFLFTFVYYDGTNKKTRPSDALVRGYQQIDTKRSLESVPKNMSSK